MMNKDNRLVKQKYKDLTGIRFNKLLVIERDFTKRKTAWICQCDCGNTKSIYSNNLIRINGTGSCGCLKSNTNITHGLSYKRIYKIFHNMKARCYNKNNKRYKNYGGRGIIVYKDWLLNIELFVDYVSKLENYEKENYTLDRINNDGNYEPGNLRWASPSTQSRNRTTTVMNESLASRIKDLYFIEKLRTIDISRKLNLPYISIHNIISGRQWV